MTDMYSYFHSVGAFVRDRLFVLCYGDGCELAQLQLLLFGYGWEACPAACMAYIVCEAPVSSH